MSLCHHDATSGFGDVPILCPFLEFLLLGHSSRHELDLANIIDVASGQFLRSRSYRQYRDRAQITLCAVLRTNVFGLWRVRTCPSHVPMTWESRVTSSITWAIRKWRKQGISSGKFCTWCSVGLDRESRMNLLPVQRFFLYSPLKFYFFIYNSHDLKKSIGNLKCETSSWSCGHFHMINAAWGSRVNFLCHVRP